MSRNLQSALGKISRKLQAKVRGIVRRGVVSNSDSSGAGQTLQTKLLADDVADGVEHFEPYGFTSHPPAGAEGLVFAVGGERAHAVGINFGSRGDRLTDLEQGEVAMYHPSGSSIVLRNTGAIEVLPAPGQTVALGATVGGLPVARAGDPVAVTVPDISALVGAINSWVPVPNDGGAALGAAITAAVTGAGAGSGTVTTGGTGSTST